MLRGVVDHPRHRRPHLGHDLVEASLGGERVLDEGEVEAGGQESLAEECVGLLVVHLPVAAVDVREGGRACLSAGKDVEPLSRRASIAEVHLGLACLAEGVAAGRPAAHVLVPLRNSHGRGIVVRGVEGCPVHSAK
jgi:hypothetical protein